MMTPKPILIAAALALGACAPDSSEIGQPAGSDIVGNTFGDAVATNARIMSNPAQATQSLALRFDAEVDSTVTFPFNSTVLTPQAQDTLRRQASWINQFPEVRFSVYGYTDLVGSAAYNEQLGRARAIAVVNYLTSLGVDRSRLTALVSYGESRPVVSTESPERLNRRAVTEVSGFVKGSGTLLDGKYAQVIYREYVESAVPTTAVTETQGAAGGE